MGTIDTLFIAHKDGERKLDQVALAVFRALGIAMWEERDSSNYPPDEHYYAGYTENTEVTVYDADDDIKPGYPFRIALEGASWRKGPGRLHQDPVAIAKILADHSFRVFVPAGPWHKKEWDGKGDEYAV